MNTSAYSCAYSMRTVCGKWSTPSSKTIVCVELKGCMSCVFVSLLRVTHEGIPTYLCNRRDKSCIADMFRDEGLRELTFEIVINVL